MRLSWIAYKAERQYLCKPRSADQSRRAANPCCMCHMSTPCRRCSEWHMPRDMLHQIKSNQMAKIKSTCCMTITHCLQLHYDISQANTHSAVMKTNQQDTISFNVVHSPVRWLRLTQVQRGTFLEDGSNLFYALPDSNYIWMMTGIKYIN